MIDTVKIVVPYSERPKWFSGISGDKKINANSGLFTTIVYPSNSYKRSGIYLPQLKYVERPTKDGRTFSLYIELSLPKLYYGNNFNELTDGLFSAVVKKLSRTLRTVYDIHILPSDIKRARLSRIDYSKNILFTDRTPVSSIVNVLQTADISKTYDVQKSDFRNGGLIYHIHTNTLDTVMYDKVADLKQSKVSERRSYEKYNYTQLSLLDELEKHKNVTIARFEIRLSSMHKIRKELCANGIAEDLSFYHLFSTDISRKILLRHWQNIFDRIQIIDTLADTATQLLLAYKQAKPDMKFAQASALTIMQLLRKEAPSERAVRNLIEGLFNREQYYRLKKLSYVPPNKAQLKELLYIAETLKTMTPVSIDKYVK